MRGNYLLLLFFTMTPLTGQPSVLQSRVLGLAGQLSPPLRAAVVTVKDWL